MKDWDYAACVTQAPMALDRYLAPWDTPAMYDPDKGVLAGVYSFITSFVLYGYLIPISLYVSLEMVKVLIWAMQLPAELFGRSTRITYYQLRERRQARP